MNSSVTTDSSFESGKYEGNLHRPAPPPRACLVFVVYEGTYRSEKNSGGR